MCGNKPCTQPPEEAELSSQHHECCRTGCFKLKLLESLGSMKVPKGLSGNPRSSRKGGAPGFQPATNIALLTAVAWDLLHEISLECVVQLKRRLRQ